MPSGRLLSPGAAMPTWTRERIIEAVKQTAAQCGGLLSGADFRRRSGLTKYQLFRHFPGGWTELRQLAGLAPHPQDNTRSKAITDEQLLQEFHRVACELGAVPTWDQFAGRSQYNPRVLRKHFGVRGGTRRRYRQWLEKNHPECPFLQFLSPLDVTGGLSGRHGTKGSGKVYGAPINFRGLLHAPTNELGVVYLFGMVSCELGLTVEFIQPAYPDCEAKRCFNRRQNRWQHVRIEFEFTSGHFRDHGHDPAGCDVIVCWEHNWPDCPLEVIELRAVTAKLKSADSFQPSAISGDRKADR